MAAKILQRSEVPAQYKWDLTDLFPTVDAWEKAFTVCQNSIEAFKKL